MTNSKEENYLTRFMSDSLKEEEEYYDIVKNNKHWYSSTIKPYMKIKAKKSNTLTPWNSKFLGTPYLPKGQTPPQASKSTLGTRPEENLYLLAQINFEEMPKLELFPEKGILQFWLAKNNFFGADDDNPTKQNGFRTIYYPEIQKENLITNLNLLPPPKDFCPFNEPTSEYALAFHKQEMFVTTGDYRFDKLVNIPPEYDLGLFDIAYTETYFADDDSEYAVHQVGGYPNFAQHDPRYSKNTDKECLLLQIDSDRKNDIWWGDAGCANFFISESNLKKKNFSEVLYHWDCS
ncbi:MAG TPA: YwqG family protein [Gammaproteobacteria bacterium]|nr:YwqG family protein [Gammaproteobacteria bacterium]